VKNTIKSLNHQLFIKETKAPNDLLPCLTLSCNRVFCAATAKHGITSKNKMLSGTIRSATALLVDFHNSEELL
jgi:hypothetical protein